MAKTQKKAAKPAKKKAAPAPKAKKPAVKKVAKKEAKEVKKEKPVAKKAAPAKKEVPEAPRKQPVMKKAAESEPIKKVVQLTKRQEAMAKPIGSPQLNIFPMLTQRPIAHKSTKTAPVDDRTRYSDDELKEFETLINKKLDKAREEFRILKETLNRNNDAGTDATSGGNTKVLEDGAETAEKENLSQLAARQQKYIMNLENALVRIKNGTYGICTVTGKLIPKERLIAVPHTTQSIEAKMMQTD
jgi:RNA polymerase-binding transcription factor DksA